MSGTIAGGKKAAQTNKENYGIDFYRRIGSKGGKNGHTGGFYGNPERARACGKIGGSISRRTGIKTCEGKIHQRNLDYIEVNNGIVK